MWHAVNVVESVSLRIQLRFRPPVPGLVLTVERDRSPNPSDWPRVNHTELGQPWRPSREAHPLRYRRDLVMEEWLSVVVEEDRARLQAWTRPVEYSDRHPDPMNPPLPA